MQDAKKGWPATALSDAVGGDDPSPMRVEEVIGKVSGAQNQASTLQQSPDSPACEDCAEGNQHDHGKAEEEGTKQQEEKQKEEKQKEEEHKEKEEKEMEEIMKENCEEKQNTRDDDCQTQREVAICMDSVTPNNPDHQDETAWPCRETGASAAESSNDSASGTPRATQNTNEATPEQALQQLRQRSHASQPSATDPQQAEDSEATSPRCKLPRTGIIEEGLKRALLPGLKRAVKIGIAAAAGVGIDWMVFGKFAGQVTMRDFGIAVLATAFWQKTLPFKMFDVRIDKNAKYQDFRRIVNHTIMVATFYQGAMVTSAIVRGAGDFEEKEALERYPVVVALVAFVLVAACTWFETGTIQATISGDFALPTSATIVACVLCELGQKVVVQKGMHKRLPGFAANLVLHSVRVGLLGIVSKHTLLALSKASAHTEALKGTGEHPRALYDLYFEAACIGIITRALIASEVKSNWIASICSIMLTVFTNMKYRASAVMEGSGTADIRFVAVSFLCLMLSAAACRPARLHAKLGEFYNSLLDFIYSLQAYRTCIKVILLLLSYGAIGKAWWQGLRVKRILYYRWWAGLYSGLAGACAGVLMEEFTLQAKNRMRNKVLAVRLVSHVGGSIFAWYHLAGDDVEVLEADALSLLTFHCGLHPFFFAATD